MVCPLEVMVVKRGMITGPVLEGGIAPVEPAVFCAVARMGSRKRRRLSFRIIVGESVPR
jgi:hypothetical protein